ncbi:hypothetical protein [Enterococcus pseudoavium]
MTTRCDECIIYHLQECKKAGVTRMDHFLYFTRLKRQQVTKVS